MSRTTASSQASQTGDAGHLEPVVGLASHSGTQEPVIKPLIYGYVRVTEDLADDELQQLECGLEKLAEAEGYCLTETRYEYQPGYYGTFYRLIAELKRTQIRHMVVPSLDHLSAHPLLRDQMINLLGEANVRVWVVEP
jgi:DNA invertase Pin-like site-specific DNA recombinase